MFSPACVSSLISSPSELRRNTLLSSVSANRVSSSFQQAYRTVSVQAAGNAFFSPLSVSMIYGWQLSESKDSFSLTTRLFSDGLTKKRFSIRPAATEKISLPSCAGSISVTVSSV